MKTVRRNIVAEPVILKYILTFWQIYYILYAERAGINEGGNQELNDFFLFSGYGGQDHADVLDVHHI